MRRNIRPIRESVVWMTAPGGGCRRAGPWKTPLMSALVGSGKASIISPGVGKIQTEADRMIFSNVIAGSAIAAQGYLVDVIGTNARTGQNLLSITNLDNAAWVTSGVTVSSAIYADMYGGTGAQSLTPVDVTSYIQQSTSYALRSNATGFFAIDLKADVAHNAQMVITNTVDTQTKTIAVTTSWQRFYFGSTAFTGIGVTKKLRVRLLPDTDLGTQLVYARFPFATTSGDVYLSSPSFAQGSVSAIEQADGGWAGEDIGCSLFPGFRQSQGTMVIMFAPMFDLDSSVTLKRNIGFLAMSLYSDAWFEFDNTGGTFNLEAHVIGDATGSNENVAIWPLDVTLSQGVFYILGMSWDTTETRLYVNGVKKATENGVTIVFSEGPESSLAMVFPTSRPAPGIYRGFRYYPYKQSDDWHTKHFNDWKKHAGL